MVITAGKHQGKDGRVVHVMFDLLAVTVSDDYHRYKYQMAFLNPTEVYLVIVTQGSKG